MNEKYYIGKAHWISMLKGWLDDYHILAPQREAGGLFLRSVTEDNISTIIYDEVRPVQPLKNYLLPPLDKVVGNENREHKPLLFLGIKACDLSALSILDQAFGNEFPDPLYQKRRNETVIVSTDCTQPLEECFCVMVNGNPYPENEFDLNLSKVWDGFVVEIGSEQGQMLLKGHDNIIKEIVKEEINARDKIRKETIQRIKNKNNDLDISDYYKLISYSWDSDVWKKHSETCVECGCCTHACPTCHCYFLDDVTRKKQDRLRGWDSCQYSGYAVTAGGGTPRPRLYERFRNRYFCKFKYLQDNYNKIGCTGCGRCIEGCQGEIDMRSALKDLAKSLG